MEQHELLYLSRAQVEEIALGLPAMIDLLETVFTEKAHGRTEMPPKPGIHTRPDAFLHAMLAHVPALNAAGIKWVGGYPANKEKGLPYISGILILNDDETGFPIAVMDSTWITAYRTAAATALSAKYLARPDSKTAGIIACGVQGRTNLEALNCLFPWKGSTPMTSYLKCRQNLSKRCLTSWGLRSSVPLNRSRLLSTATLW